MNSSLRWVRGTQNAMLGGVCAGIARALDLPVWAIRLTWIFSVFIFGFGILLYIGCFISLPRDDRQELARKKMVLGVCSAIDRRGDIELGLARLIALILLFATGGAALIGYIVLYFIFSEPNRPRDQTLSNNP